MRLAAAVCLAIAAMLAVVTRTSAESSLDAIRGRGELRVGVRTDVPLLGFRGAGGGITGFEIDLARYLARRIQENQSLELMAPPSLSIVCFRYAPANRRDEPDRIDALNKALLERLQLGGEAFLSSTILSGRFVLRACIVNPRSTEADIDMLVGLVERIGSEL